MFKKWFPRLEVKSCLVACFGSAFLAFGLYNVHSLSGVTEGGVLGLTLLLENWFHISPSLSGLVLNLLCYGMGWRLLGKEFIAYSLLSAGTFSLSYGIFEQFEPLWPELYQYPLLAAVLGAVFVGVGAGLCVRMGGAPGGDDALAMSLAQLTKWPIQRWYLISDLVVLGLSLTYIPLKRIGFSLLTVILSGQIIGWVQKFPVPWMKEREDSK